jgi:hypothetical protein
MACAYEKETKAAQAQGMLSPDQISELHRLHFVEKWSLRKIARHMRIGRRTIAKYLEAPAAKAAHRDRSSKLDPFKEIIAELLQHDPLVHILDVFPDKNHQEPEDSGT